MISARNWRAAASGIVDVEMAGKREPGEARGQRRPGLARTLIAPAGEELGIALALDLDQLAQELAVAVAYAILVEANGEGDELGLEIDGLIGKSAKVGKDAGIAALGDFADHRGNRLSLSP